MKAAKSDQLKSAPGSLLESIAATARNSGTHPKALDSFRNEIQAGVAKGKTKEAMKNYPALAGIFSGFGVIDNTDPVSHAIDELSRLRNLTVEITFYAKKMLCQLSRICNFWGEFVASALKNF
jgi:hypothetical protein